VRKSDPGDPNSRYLDTQHYADDFAALRFSRGHKGRSFGREYHKRCYTVTVVGYGPARALPVTNMPPSPLRAQPHVYMYGSQPRQRKTNRGQRYR
jgi:hypothetical protein